MGTLRIDTLEGDGGFDSYVAEPQGNASPRAAVVVIQEIFGINEGIRRKCDHWAEKGYLAFAPDLFWRLRPGVELDPDVPEEFKQALELMGRFDQDQGVVDIEATIRAARARLGEGGKVGIVGYCLGGRWPIWPRRARTRTQAWVIMRSGSRTSSTRKMPSPGR
jgi:carboxymethylenebutenolidase